MKNKFVHIPVHTPTKKRWDKKLKKHKDRGFTYTRYLDYLLDLDE